MAELTPMPSANVTIASKVNPGDLQSCRTANRKSFIWICNLWLSSYSGSQSVLHDLAIKQMHCAFSVAGETFVVRNHADRCATDVQIL